MSETTALALPAPEALPALFRQPEEIDRLIGRIEEEARAHVPDVASKKGRDAIASLAFKVARSKTALDDAGKQLNSALREQINVVDAERRKVRDRFDALKDEVRAPLNAWEAAEDARVEGIKARIERIKLLGERTVILSDGADEVVSPSIALDRLKRGKIDDSFQEFEAEALRAYVAATEMLESAVEAEAKADAERQELERLRAAEAARVEAERLKREAEEADQAKIAAEKAEADRQVRIDREKAEAVAKARADAERAAAEREAQAERERQEAETKRIAEARMEQEMLARQEAEREAEHKRQLAEAKAAAERAAQVERDRIAEEQRKVDERAAKRAADQKHRARIKTDIVRSLKTFGLDDGQADSVADALMTSKIPHCEAIL